ncbi:hypothetical protein ACJ2A9_00265 [Anaerobacillus sp. MEB173]|uniref:hypothetical protein n=1 Tax=Anaerobacillus sp. MEB173 TaxID=3383345 RepID=UPI003F928F0B
MLHTQNVELFHRNGQKYVIAGIPIVKKQDFRIQLKLQKLIDEIDGKIAPESKYYF